MIVFKCDVCGDTRKLPEMAQRIWLNMKKTDQPGGWEMVENALCCQDCIVKARQARCRAVDALTKEEQNDNT
ncbi:hypothetical protein LCGC14_2757430 [marine sediment metagenome]|uniref:Uncharacterized protein n=1 Tax=marine sediment metagenome TaxID=412755 RepID=A0A0F8YZY8_9ZZZZ